jgi:tRNA(adenine34) deaminase
MQVSTMNFVEDYMRQALAQAQMALQAGEVPVGAVVVREGRIIARAHNERERLGDPTAHAEVLALRRAAQTVGDWRLEDCTMVVTLEPCPMCAGAIVQARLGQLFFGAYDMRYGCCGSVLALPEDERLQGACRVAGGFLEEECAALMRTFMQDRR